MSESRGVPRVKEKLVKAESFQFWTGAIVVPVLLAAVGIVVPLVCFRSPDLSETARLLLTREFRRVLDTHWTDPSKQQAELDRVAAQFLAEQGSNYQPAVAALREQTSTRLALAFEGLERGKKLIAAGRFDRALAEFRSATNLDPENAIAWSNLGAAATLVHDLPQAREAYDRARLLAPQDPVILYNFGLLLAEQGEDQAAREHIRRALREAPLEARRSLAADLKASPFFAQLASDSQLRTLLQEVPK